MSTYVQVNIGRSVGAEPMNADAWEAFQSAIVRAFIDAMTNGLENVEIHTGQGFWNDDVTGDLVSEDSVHVSSFGDYDVSALRADVSAIGHTYGQDAVALIVGSELV